MKKLYLRYPEFNITSLNNDLVSLSLEFDSLSPVCGLSKILPFLENNQTLTELKLYRCIISIYSLEKLVHLNTNLTTLILKNTNIGYNSPLLANLLKNNRTITTLGLQNNNIGGISVSYLADSLKINTTLTKLNINNNNIGNYGIFYLTEALKTNTSLKTLCLKNCNIANNGLQYMASTLKINTTLTGLNLNQNNFSRSIIQSFADLLTTNTILTKVEIGDNMIDSTIISLKNTVKLNYIRKINKEKLCLQVVCLKKINQLGKTNEVKTLIPTIYENCVDKYNKL